jgi:hypothetical protein
MFGFSRQRRSPQLGLCALMALAMMPVGQPMPAAPSAATIQSGSETAPRAAAASNRFGVLTEDDLGIEHHDFLVIQHVIRQAPQGPTDWLISFVWTERLHRPPIQS